MARLQVERIVECLIVARDSDCLDDVASETERGAERKGAKSRAFAGLDSFEEQFLDREAITRELVKFAMQQRDKEDSNDREERPASMANKGLGNPTD